MSLARLAKTLIQGAQDGGETLAAYPVVVAGTTNANVIRTARTTDDGELVVGLSTTTTNTVNTELPAASALADAEANPTVPRVGAMGMLFDGSTEVWRRQRADAVGRAQITGGLGDGLANTLNPVVIGQEDNVGLVRVAFAAAADGLLSARVFGAGELRYNGATHDRARNNVEALVTTQTGATGSFTGSDRTNHNGRGVTGYLNVTVNPGGAQTLTFNLQIKDEAGSDGYVTIATSGALAVFGAAAAATGLEVIMTYPGAAETAALVGWTTQSLKMSRTYRWTVVHSGAGAWTYTVADVVEE